MRRLLLLGIAVYAFVLLSRFPAGVAVSWFAPEGVQLYGVSGTVWDGRAQAVAVGNTVLGETTWDLAPFWLLTGRASADVTTRLKRSQVDGQVSASLFGNRVKVRDLQGIVALPDLPQNLWQNVGITSMGGRLGLAFSSIEMKEGFPVDATGSVDVVNLDIVTPIASEDLGSFEIIFDGANEGSLIGTVADTDSSVELDGKLAFLDGRIWRLEATAKAAPGASRNIVQALDSFGKAAPGGGALITQEGTL